MTTDTSEKGLEELILHAMTGRTDILVPTHKPSGTSAPVAWHRWQLNNPNARRSRAWSPPHSASAR